ncbi:MAG: hypothetical protein NUV47_03400 [Patescibacteria group bacterium]|nr:hypothetical protein [Patescibacteria group bacterium]
MSDKKFLLFDTIPSWYKLRWKPVQNKLEIHISEAYIQAVPAIPKDSGLMQYAKKKISENLFSSFNFDLTKDFFGFNESIFRKCVIPETKFVVFSISLPRIHISTGLSCQNCNNTGEYNNRQCPHCNGSKNQMVYQWDNAYTITESLQILFNLLNMGLEVEMSKDVLPQLFSLSICAERNMHGSSMSGHLSKDGLILLRDVIATGKNCCVALENKISDALKHSWFYMMKKQNNDYNCHYLRAEIREDANLCLTIPGDAAGVYTINENSRRDTEKRGCDVSCHNMDNPAQALACLVGLSVFFEELEQKWNE